MRTMRLPRNKPFWLPLVPEQQETTSVSWCSLQGGAADVPWALWHQDPNPSSSKTCWHGSVLGAGEHVKQIEVITLL